MTMIFPGQESKLLEFKSQLPKFEALIKTAIGFANASGGRIVIGVTDQDHEVIGVSENDCARIYNDFPNSLYDLSCPNLIAQIYEQNFGDKSVIIIEIPVCYHKPYFLKSQGRQHGTYIRVGSSTRKASLEYIADLEREARRISYDEEGVAQSKLSIISKELLHAFFNSTVTKKRLLAEKIITQHQANKELYCPTVAGVLMFCEEPHLYIPESLIRCTRFQGTSGRDIINTEDVTGTIEQQAANSLKVITNWLMTSYELRGIKLSGTLPIPVVALREAIINALLHRKYNIPGAIKIAVYDDRIEIFNPGCFPGLVDTNHLGDGTTYLRNPALVRLAYQMHLVEIRGTGIKLIYNSCIKARLKKPTYHEDGDFVKLVFYLSCDPNACLTEGDAIMAFANNRATFVAKEIAELLEVSHNTAIRKLNKLIASGKVKKIGAGAASKYRAING